MNDRQLELSLPKLASCRRGRHGQTRARWWFDRMRQIIDLAPGAAKSSGSDRGRAVQPTARSTGRTDFRNC